jgi:hypothetical protein
MDFWESSNPFTQQLASNHVHEQFSLSALYRLYICSPFKQIRFMCWTRRFKHNNCSQSNNNYLLFHVPYTWRGRMSNQVGHGVLMHTRNRNKAQNDT